MAKPRTRKQTVKRVGKRRNAQPKRSATRRRTTRKAAPKRSSRTRNGCHQGRSRRRNSEAEQAAREMFEQFHGKPAEKIEVIDITEQYQEYVAECGRLLKLTVKMHDGRYVDLENFKDCKVCATPDGGQLYFLAGDQRLDLDGLGLGDQLPKDHVSIGVVHVIEYHTTKGFHDFAPTDYYHHFGEEGGERPHLNYDTLNEKLYLSGGSYQVRPEGIVD